MLASALIIEKLRRDRISDLPCVFFLCNAAVVWLSSDIEGSKAPLANNPPQLSAKRRAPAQLERGSPATGANNRPRKERQPNWGGPEVLALIHAKEKEHEALKLTGDSRELMESATQKWTKVATDVSKAGFSSHFRGALACKDKWQTLFADFKKISDYKGATGNREDYFHMANKRRKELTLPPNFCASHFREMEKFLSQRPCMNPPRQVDSFFEEDDDFQSTEDLARYCAAQHITEEMLHGDQGSTDPAVQQNFQVPKGSGPAGPRLPRQPHTVAHHSSKGKEKLENAANNMSCDPRPPNTAVRRRHSSTQSKMVEVTEAQGKELVSNIQKLSNTEERKVAAASEIADKQLQYFRIRDSEIAMTQRGLVQAVNNLSEAIVKAYARGSSGTPRHDYPQPTTTYADLATGAGPCAHGGFSIPAPTADTYFPTAPPQVSPKRCVGQGDYNADVDMHSASADEDATENIHSVANIGGQELQ